MLPFRGDSSAEDYASIPEIAVLENQNIMVTSHTNDAGVYPPKIKVDVFDQLGGVVSPERTIRSTINAYGPSITALSNGNAVIAWNGRDASDAYEAQYKIVNALGDDLTVLKTIPGA